MGFSHFSHWASLTFLISALGPCLRLQFSYNVGLKNNSARHRLLIFIFFAPLSPPSLPPPPFFFFWPRPYILDCKLYVENTWKCIQLIRCSRSKIILDFQVWNDPWKTLFISQQLVYLLHVCRTITFQGKCYVMALLLNRSDCFFHLMQRCLSNSVDLVRSFGGVTSKHTLHSSGDPCLWDILCIS